MSCILEIITDICTKPMTFRGGRGRESSQKKPTFTLKHGAHPSGIHPEHALLDKEKGANSNKNYLSLSPISIYKTNTNSISLTTHRTNGSSPPPPPPYRSSDNNEIRQPNKERGRPRNREPFLRQHAGLDEETQPGDQRRERIRIQPDTTSDPNSAKIYFKDGAHYVDPDPGHSFQATREQIFGSNDTMKSADPAPMNGFVQQARSMSEEMTDLIMNGFQPNKVAIYKALESEFAVFDRWFASVPASTQPNRLYVHSGTAMVP